MRDFATLQLRKNWLAGAGLTAAFALNFPLGALIASRTGSTPGEVYRGLLLFWTLMGLPISALLIGATSGASLRLEPQRSADEPLPLSPRARLAGGLLAAAVQLAGVGAVVLAAELLLSPGLRAALSGPFTFATPFLKPLLNLLGLMLGAGLLLSFALGYALKHALAGGLLAAVAVAATAFPLSAGLALEDAIGSRAAFAGFALLAGAAALAGPLWALGRLAGWGERGARLGRRGWAAVVAGLAGGALLSLFLFELGSGRAARSLRFVDGRLWRDDPLHAIPVPDGGALLSGLGGSIVHVDGAGRRTRLLEPSRRTLWELFLAGIDREQAAWDRDGRLCVLSDLFTDAGSALHCGRPASGLARVAVLPRALGVYRIESFGDGLVLFGWRSVATDRSRHRHAVIPKNGAESLVWREGEPRTDALLGELGYRGGSAAKLSADRHRVSAKGAPDCLLPGRAVINPLIHPYLPVRRLGTRAVFTTPVELARGERALAVCEGGRARLEWRGDADANFALRMTADGTLWGWRDGRTLHLAGADGFQPPLPLDAALWSAQKFPELLRRAEGSLWILAGQQLRRVDEKDGRLLESWPLPNMERLRGEHERAHRVIETGLLVHDGRRLWLIDWNGKRKPLGRA